MMDAPLTLTRVLERAETLFGEREVVTAYPDRTHRYTYGEAYERICRLAHALDDHGVASGARVASLARNNHRHVELYFAPACAGRSLHVGNVRLPADELAATLNESADRVVFADPDFVETLEAVADDLETVEQYVVLSESVPETSLSPVTDYESFIEGYDTEYDWPELDEESECGRCYTSGTTGDPKGVAYTHRGLFLHTLMNGHVDAYGVGADDSVLPVVPMYHVNAWGFPYAAAFGGARLVLPDARTDPGSLASLLDGEGVTITAGVPTVWRALADHLDSGDADVSGVTFVVGGASMPASLVRTFEEAHGATVRQGWGMTETSPLGTLMPSDARDGVDGEERYERLATVGRPVPGVSARVRDEDGERVPRDGETVGRFEVRGPWVADGYVDDADEADATDDGWLSTGDLATWDDAGYVDVVDREDDLVKSGGEWISTVALEDELMAHEAVREAAVVAVPDETWGERPLAVIVPDGDAPSADALDAHLESAFPSWWAPDEYVVREEIPLTTTGKFDKRALREAHADERSESANSANGDQREP